MYELPLKARMINAKRKAQLSSLDLILAVSIFSIVLAAFFLFIYAEEKSFESEKTRVDMLNKAQLITDILLESPGSPKNWETIFATNPSSVKAIGLSNFSRVIDGNKLDVFLGINYFYARDLFNIAPYHYYLEMTYTDGTVLGTSGNLSEVSAAKNVVALQRFATYSNETIRIMFKLSD
ncbi:MAG: hypothetical protein Q8O89_08635 [Nanoarchaeota archaeon]|nr:hypothetical protein [Nanoarchaeota archaeon]